MSEEPDGICARYHIFHRVRSNLSNEDDGGGQYNLLHFSLSRRKKANTP